MNLSFSERYSDTGKRRALKIGHETVGDLYAFRMFSLLLSFCFSEAMMHIISALYAKTLVILGIAFPVTDAIATDEYDTFNGFYIYLYSGSILFLAYMYVIQLREKSIQDNWRHPSNKRESRESTAIVGLFQKKNTYIRYGSFYFRMGVTGFGIGSVIYSAFQFGEYWELSDEKDCDNLSRAIKPLLRIIFALMQMLFIFSYSNFLEVRRSKLIANFGLMHMIATNLCEWFFVLVQETQGDIYKSAQKRQWIAARDNLTLSEIDFHFINSNSFQITKSYFEHKDKCLKSKIMQPIIENVQTYLSPFTVEYSLLCSVILALMWKNNCVSDGDGDATRDLSAEISRQSGCNVIYSRSQSQFSVDCAQSHKGLFVGILALSVTIISLIIFFELVSRKEFKDTTVLQVNVWEAVLFWTATVAVLYCIVALRDVSLSEERRGLELEHLLLLVTQCGVFMYFLFQIIGGILMGTNKGTGGLMRQVAEKIRIITPFSALVQSSCQTVLVLDAWRRRCSTESQMRRKPGRQLVTFLLVTNISLWFTGIEILVFCYNSRRSPNEENCGVFLLPDVSMQEWAILQIVNRLKNTRSVSHPNQMDFYGVLAWNVITHVSMPLVISYRFQSTVCFYEIWKHVYKTRPIKRGLCDYKDDQRL
ncbi:hypothetical protein NQ318_010967 [Aromia moschata]|uniref:Uncharacterized protein n=1 Tax=Aromia moschata TaxID=1265417 RepID=A0AAV8YLK7_9CUCU|nr:hypothetical protein NQ318_010967 [Aromia moschata]